MLLIAQLALNNNASETTKTTPFFANYGKDPNLFITALPNPSANRALKAADKLAEAY